jgi:hypothetical protein
VQLGVPGCNERYAHDVSDKSAELPNVARAGYVDDVRLERAKGVGEQVPVSPQGKVVLLSPIDRKRHRASFQVKGSDGTDGACPG